MSFTTGSYGPEALVDGNGDAQPHATVQAPVGYTATIDALGNLTVTGPAADSVTLTITPEGGSPFTTTVTVAPAVADLQSLEGRVGSLESTVATDAELAAAVASKAPLASPAFTGNPTAPTPTAGDSDTSLATTAFVAQAIAAQSATSVQRGEPASSLRTALPYLSAAIRTQNDAAPTTRRVIGLGSSVGVGATLTNAAVDAPSAYFATALGKALNRLGNLTLALTNGSVNGTTIYDGYVTDYAAAKTAAGGTPTVVALAYGMNDGMPAQYHAGNTYPGAYTKMVQLIQAIRADGGDPVVMTSPHPHSSRTPWALPNGVTASYSPAVPDYTLAASVVTKDWLDTGVSVVGSYRHFRINEAMRQAAIDTGCAVIDVERYWFKAVATYGEDALFNVGEYAHPNDLGHAQSYHAAIDDFMHTLSRGVATNGVPALGALAPTATATDVFKAADQTVSNTTTSAVDADLKFTVGTGETWIAEGTIYYTSPSTAPVKFWWAVPNGTLGNHSVIGGPTGSVTTYATQNIEGGGANVGVMPASGVSTVNVARVTAFVRNTGAGTVNLKWGQNVADAGTTTVLKGSTLRFRKVG